VSSFTAAITIIMLFKSKIIIDKGIKKKYFLTYLQRIIQIFFFTIDATSISKRKSWALQE
jgi:hypothetical protein